MITDAVMQLYDKIVHPKLLIKRITVTANHLVEESRAEQTPKYEQLDLLRIIVCNRNSRQRKMQI